MGSGRAFMIPDKLGEAKQLKFGRKTRKFAPGPQIRENTVC